MTKRTATTTTTKRGRFQWEHRPHNKRYGFIWFMKLARGTYMRHTPVGGSNRASVSYRARGAHNWTRVATAVSFAEVDRLVRAGAH